MGDGPSGFDFFNSLVGGDQKAEISKDGKAINVTSEIADGIPGTFTIRPSKSSGSALTSTSTEAVSDTLMEIRSNRRAEQSHGALRHARGRLAEAHA